MATAQSGIFGLGTNSHEYVEFDVRPGVPGILLVRTVAGLREPRSTMGGVNLVSAFRPSLWRAASPADIPPDLRDFDEPVRGVDGYSMPATQHDLWLWIAGATNDVVFDMVADCLRAVAAVATVAEETRTWPYHHDRDLTGFIDGTANPSVTAAPDAVLVPDGQPGAGGSVLLFQKWRHDFDAWTSLSVAEQERVMGRTKADSIELEGDARDPASHVARTDQELDDLDLDVFRRNTPYGVVTDHGTMFVGFARDQARLARMLARMAGAEDGVRDALTRYADALTGAYYWVPSVESLRRFSSLD